MAGDFSARREGVGKASFLAVFSLDGGFLGLTQYTELQLKGEGSQDPHSPPSFELDQSPLKGERNGHLGSTESQCSLACGLAHLEPEGRMAGNL